MKFWMTPWHVFGSRSELEEWYLDRSFDLYDADEIDWDTVDTEEVDTAELVPGFHRSISAGTGMDECWCTIEVKEDGSVALGFGEPDYDRSDPNFPIYNGELNHEQKFSTVAEFEKCLNDSVKKPAKSFIEAVMEADARADAVVAEHNERKRGEE